MTSAIRTQSLSKRFRRTVALRDLDLDVPPGSIYGLLGPNGAGKTTTIKVLMNIFGPSGGRSEVLGTDSRRLGPADFTRIGYVSENQEMPEWMTGGLFSRLPLGILSGVGRAPWRPNWRERSNCRSTARCGACRAGCG